MYLYAGIDEAGYGPMLGPLCVGCAAFAIAGERPERGAPDLWRLLRAGVCRSPRDRRRRVAVADSKKLKASNETEQPLRHLERGVLGFFGACGREVDDDGGLFEHLGTSVPPAPWYRSTTELPLGHEPDELRIAAAVLRRAMVAAGVRCELLACEVVSAEAFNRQVETMGNKAAVNLGCVMRRVDELWRRWAGHDPHVVVDRQGGRVHYLRPLQLSFPDAAIRIVAEDEPLSRYRLERGGSTLTVSFLPAAEERHLPVALASMAAKLVRELLMLRLNRFFRERMPQLRPTAGYVTDARRFLIEIKPLLAEMELPRSRLIRSV